MRTIVLPVLFSVLALEGIIFLNGGESSLWEATAGGVIGGIIFVGISVLCNVGGKIQK